VSDGVWLVSVAGVVLSAGVVDVVVSVGATMVVIVLAVESGVDVPATVPE
jgi:hypothetical protein